MEIKESKALKSSLALPILVPALLAHLIALDLGFPQRLLVLVLFIVYSGLIGGIPYVVLVALILGWVRGKSDTQFKRALVLSPILMLPVFFLCLALFNLITLGFLSDAFKVKDVREQMLFYLWFILGFGYSYVLLVFGAVFVLKRLSVVTPSPAI